MVAYGKCKCGLTPLPTVWCVTDPVINILGTTERIYNHGSQKKLKKCVTPGDMCSLKYSEEEAVVYIDINKIRKGIFKKP